MNDDLRNQIDKLFQRLTHYRVALQALIHAAESRGLVSIEEATKQAKEVLNRHPVDIHAKCPHCGARFKVEP